MASISSTSSLGNTALRGFGGMASGIDRDSIIEKMTLGTTTKINNQKKKVTELQWKQEAYRNISDKIIDWADTYASYSSSKNLKDFTVFAKNQISIRGAESSTRFVSATGTSSMVNNVSLLGVKQLATSTVQKSDAYFSTTGLGTDVNDLYKPVESSKLQGFELSFSTYNVDGERESSATFKFADSYTDETTGKSVSINYLEKDLGKLTDQLNALLGTSEATVGGVALNKVFKFGYSGDQIVLERLDDAPSGIKVEGSDALKYLGVGSGQLDEGKLAFDGNIKMDNAFKDTAVKKESLLDFLTGKKVTFNYDGSKKSIELITKTDAENLKNLSVGATGYSDSDGKLSSALNKLIGTSDLNTVTMDDLNRAFEEISKQSGLSMTEREELRMTVSDAKAALAKAQKNMLLTGDPKVSIDSLDPSKPEDLEKYKNLGGLQGRLNQAFGTGMVVARFDTKSNKLSFDTANDGSTVSLIANDSEMLKHMGIAYGASNKVNLSGNLQQSVFKEHGINVGENDNLDLEINGVKIDGLTGKSSINDILSKINSSAAGVKATYVESTGEFMLVSSETGKGREINLKDGLTKTLFGSDDEKKKIEGKNAEILVSYGGVNVFMERSSNTFDLEGLNVTVSGTFGGVEYNKDKGEWESSTAEAITFSAKADVEGALEKVKSFIEDYNALVTEINTQIRTRPDRNYGALTDEQKAEMDETSIENWEKKAKEGILYGDAAMRDLSMDVQSVFTKMMNNGASYEDLKEIGITYSEDWGDGGTLVFDESKFKTAMENDPEKVSNIFTGGGSVKKGLIDTIDETFVPYATRYGSKNDNGNGKGSYGRLIEIAGSEKKPTTLLENEIYKQLKEMQETIDSLNERLKMEQDRYISQFTTMESLLNQMNTQSSYLSQLTA